MAVPAGYERPLEEACGKTMVRLWGWEGWGGGCGTVKSENFNIAAARDMEAQAKDN